MYFFSHVRVLIRRRRGSNPNSLPDPYCKVSERSFLYIRLQIPPARFRCSPIPRDLHGHFFRCVFFPPKERVSLRVPFIFLNNFLPSLTHLSSSQEKNDLSGSPDPLRQIFFHGLSPFWFFLLISSGPKTDSF